MAKIYDTLHPKTSPEDELYPNIDSENNIKNNSISGEKLKDGSIFASKLASGNFDTTIREWLDEHPEATTTVQDGSIILKKLNSEIIEDTNQLIDFNKLIMVNGLSRGGIIDGGFYNSSGNIVSNDTTSYFPYFIRVKPSTNYVLTYDDNNIRKVTKGYYIVIYDKNFEIIGYTALSTNYIEIPENALWIKVSIRKEHKNKISLYETGVPYHVTQEYFDFNYMSLGLYKSIINNITNKELIKLNSTHMNEFTSKHEEYRNLEPIKTVSGYYLNISLVYTTASGWSYKKFNIINGKTYRIRTRGGVDAILYAITDCNDNIIEYNRPETLTNHDVTVTINNENACYMYINGRLADTYFNVYLLDDIYSVTGADIYNILSGKTLVCCGDSITEGYHAGIDPTTGLYKSYGWQIANRNNMTFYNKGVSGSTMQALENHNGFSIANGRYTQLPDNIDYLTIWFGWNDNAYGTLGTINDDTNQTFYGAYNVVMPYLINKYPMAKICLIVPYGSSYGHREAVRLLANKWGVACFDMYQGGTPLFFGKETYVNVDPSIVASNKTKFLADGTHPNFDGHRELADMLEHFLRGL